MVDFKKLRESKAKPRPMHPREIFNALPKPPDASQAEVLDAWFVRRTDKDVVVKLHTGGGKTLVALLMAQSVMNDLNEPVIYLAPTNQLVEQVLAKSREYGVSAVPYVKKQPLPAEFMTEKAFSSERISDSTPNGQRKCMASDRMSFDGSKRHQKVRYDVVWLALCLLQGNFAALAQHNRAAGRGDKLGEHSPQGANKFGNFRQTKGERAICWCIVIHPQPLREPQKP
jgi:hypothetical protein